MWCRVQYSDLVGKEQVLQLRLSDAEKAGFQTAAALGGISLSAWARERLRLAAIRELESAGQKVPFVTELRLEVEGG
jgi:hypothetical protein